MGSPPKNIGPYRVLTPIASGGMAEVFEVEDPASGERLALKLLQNLKVALKRFNREYEAMARLNHPGVVRVYHYGLHHGRPWLTMEFLQGQNAHLWTKEFGPPGTREREDEVLRVGYQISTALHYVHDRGLVHRDLKSANVLVLPDSRVKLVDFGTAHLVDAAERITREGEFVGTFAYASPEQLQGGRLTYRSDLYSLGVLLYRLATGRRPFASRDPSELAWEHIHEAPPDPREHVSNCPDPLAELILALLAKDPADRPQSAGHVAAAIERLAGRPYSSRVPVALHRKSSTQRHVERERLWGQIERGPWGQVCAVAGELGSDADRFVQTVSTEALERGWISAPCVLTPRRDLVGITRLFLSLGRGLEHVDEVAAAIDGLREHSRVERRSRPESRAVVIDAAARLVGARARVSSRSVLLSVARGWLVGPQAGELLASVMQEVRRRGIPASVLIAVRPASLDDDQGLAQLLRGCWRLDLEPLSPADVAFAAGTMLGCRPPPAWLARRMHEISGGQPEYLEQVVEGLVSAGELMSEADRVEWDAASLDLRAPRQAVADAASMLAAIPVSWRRVLEAFSLTEQGTVEVLARLLDWSEEELSPVVRGLCTRGLLGWEDKAQTRPAWGHPAVGTAVRRQLSPVRRAALSAVLARVVAKDPEPSTVQVRALNTADRPVDAAKLAAPVARELFDGHRVRSALTVLEPVVRGLAGKSVPNTRTIAEVFLLHSLCLQAINPAHTDTARTLGLARRLCGTGDVEMLARVQWGQATLARAIGHYRNYARFVDEALNTLGTDASGAHLHAWLRIEQGHARRLQGAVGRALRSYGTAEKIGRKLRKMRMLARATVGLAGCYLDQGDLQESERQASRAMAQLERIGDQHGFWQALAVWGQAMRRQGRYSDALSVLYQRAPEARHHEDPRAYSALLLTLAWCELDLERLGRAQEYVDELAATTGRGEHLHVRLETGLVHGRILLTSGQRRQAAYILQGVEQKARLAELRVLAEQARAWHAEALWSLGDKDTSRSMYQSAILGLMGLGTRPALADACISRSRALIRERDVDELYQPLRKWLEEGPPPVVRLEELLARGSAARRRGDRDSSRQAHREAAMVLNRVATDLNDTDRAALRVHTWSRRIRRGLR